MLLDRILIALLITAVLLTLFIAWRVWHKRRIEKITHTSGTADQGNLPTILYFRGDSCAICPTQSQFIANLQAEWGAERLVVRVIDAEKERDTAVQYAILTLPTTVLLNGRGEVQHINYGLTNQHKLAQQLEKIQ